MVSIKINQLKMGDKLIEDVLTPLGSTLFAKDRVISERDLDILTAFMVTRVQIATSMTEELIKKEEVAEAKAGAKVIAPVSPFIKEYDKMVDMLRNVPHLILANQPIPLMDIRQQLEKIFNHISEYNLITFAPAYLNNIDYVMHKSVLTSLTSYLLAQWVGFPQKDWMQIALAGLLMDIGNARIDSSILSKPGQLTDSEKDEMKKHTIIGYQILRNITALNEGVKLAALQHHERVDGSGYPNGFDGKKLHPYSKIVAVADIYHAMTLNKVYRKPISPYLVMEQIQSDAFGKLDPVYVRIFIEKVAKFNTGTKVKLSDNRIGEIVFFERDYPTRPWVSINNVIVNLTIERNLHIIEVLQ
ncbi:MAG: HD-GYP domain-containing protein [Candidatus Pristimantibacillus lignocellulolyticus]|uniref:HD-GYP domain-containing protein n=1 Tax=Candidatus Pristimantibacillus lignocellulolyticus TaxID=2994561 RepID=A0A9J6ZJD9_9BACL|nr:MAG: HD-GYP domain-containing protein [Candidatus Pristimantibacillus lignocellulolyticus]